MKNRDRSPIQKQRTTPKIAILPEPRSFSSKTPQGEINVASKLETATNPFHFSNLTVSTVEPSSPSTPNQSLIPGSVQAKLTIGEPNNSYEQEADNVAKTVVKHIDNSQSDQEQPALHQMPTVAAPLMRLPLQRQSSIAIGPASHDFEKNLNQARTGGSPLAPNVQSQMESAMGADFSGVKVHTDSQAAHLSQSIQAKAFTTGQDVFFKQGEYNPDNRSGQELLAHELTHVMQQNSSAVRRQPITASAQSIIQRDLEIQDVNTSYTVDEITELWGIEDEHKPALQGILQTIENSQTTFATWDDLEQMVDSVAGDQLVQGMESLKQDDLSWTPSAKFGGAKSLRMQNVFYGWLVYEKLSKSDIRRYRVTQNPGAMNCYEAVLYGAYRAGLVTKDFIIRALKVTGVEDVSLPEWVQRYEIGYGKFDKAAAFLKQILKSPSGQCDPKKARTGLPTLPDSIPRGHIVLFGTAGQHVALSTGNKIVNSHGEAKEHYGDKGHEILELDSTTDGVESSTVEDAVARNSAYRSFVSWGPLPSV
ncbi:DUF4157 domain-containing protein [Leptolyngbya cf. ectocarpi LEGE 11479]|uniref:DUF4157 domain-containing protein n=1 Tax=Leptolyngbya cf. ectocarpi LEGE 11479 TaxID=1828722 RepID=A0A928ZZ25_LEPEC|nr:DUF4157 domain-containing protein [Leptolyngbya ectocarpi]MBE9070077.1 DUF4157 domain-containing protein [Leptolyngbya cf. ectocarpi LEGE 11479]